MVPQSWPSVSGVLGRPPPPPPPPLTPSPSQPPPTTNGLSGFALSKRIWARRARVADRIPFVEERRVRPRVNESLKRRTKRKKERLFLDQHTLLAYAEQLALILSRRVNSARNSDNLYSKGNRLIQRNSSRKAKVSESGSYLAVNISFHS